MGKKINFEQSFQRLEEIAQLLESGDTTLEESMALYEEGMKLVKTCGTALNEAEAKISKLTRDDDGELVTTPLDSPQ